MQEDQPLMGHRDRNTSEFTGFDVEIARMIVEALGYDIVLVGIKPPERQSALQEGRVDLVVASFSITEERRKVVGFAGPYLAVRQEVLVMAGKAAAINTVAQLKRHRVCTGSSTTSKDRLISKGFDLNKLELRSTSRQCVDAMLAGEVDAVSTDATILAGFMDEFKGKFVRTDMGWDVSEELGIGVPHGDDWLAGLVGDILLENHKQGKNSRWQVAYNRNLAPVLGDVRQPMPRGVRDLIDTTDKAKPAGMGDVAWSGAPTRQSGAVPSRRCPTRRLAPRRRRAGRSSLTGEAERGAGRYA